MSATDLKERALQDPGSVFATPEAVVANGELPVEHKRSILQRWRQLVGSDAPTPRPSGDEAGLATRFARALSFLDTETGGHPVTHNQGFYTAIGDIKQNRSS